MTVTMTRRVRVVVQLAGRTGSGAAMEKFRTFEDPATGIMPFMPHKAIVSKNPLFRLVRAGMGLCLVLLRLPILLVLTCILVIGSALASLVPVAALRRPLVRLVDGTCCRLLLLTLG